MMLRASVMAAFAFCALFWPQLVKAADVSKAAQAATSPPLRSFEARGEIVSLVSNRTSVTIRHSAISNYMAAMTMPFHLRNPVEVAGLSVGDKVSFRLNVTDTESWVDEIRKTGGETLHAVNASESRVAPPASRPRSTLFSCKFTNELGQAVSIDDFHGQALAITFFYTRCPLPDYCPRLSKNFEMAMKKLESNANTPTNWHFLSVTFDPLVDTPAMLKNYAMNYGYDPAHWSFLTGAPEKIEALARGSGVTYRTVDGTIDHDFRTLIVNPAGLLQMVFPVGGDLSDSVADEILSSLSTTNRPAETVR